MEPIFTSIDEGPTVADERWLSEYGQNGSAPIVEAFTGLTHAEALALELAPERFLVRDLIPVGAVGTIAGVPETHKSFIAQAAAVRIAAGEGELLGCQVESQASVGYFWQDDSTRSELERIKLFERVHESPDDLAVWWFLNIGVQLPTDIPRLRMTVDEFGLRLIVLDSFYNFAAGLDLKDADAELLVAMLKKEIADPCECTVLIVDHMPWATDTNRGRLRSYGGVFKGAATRFGIYIDANGNKTWIEARGNNIVGFKRTLAEWDHDALEMRLIETPEAVDESEYEDRILEALEGQEYGLTTDEMNAIKGTKTHLVAARARLIQAGKVVRRKDRTSFAGFVWYLAQPGEESGSEVETNQYDLLDQPSGSANPPPTGVRVAAEPVSLGNRDSEDEFPF